MKLPTIAIRKIRAPGLALLAFVTTAAFGFAKPAIAAEVTEVNIARGFAIPHLPIMVMEHDKLLEKRLAAAGLPDVKVTYTQIGSGNVMNDSLLAGPLAFATGGPPPLLTLWDRTRGTIQAIGVCAEATMPLYLNTRNPNVKTVADFTEQDRIVVSAPKVSIQAILLQMAAAKVFGAAQFGKLDARTVGMSAPDGTMALRSGGTEITANFSIPPFQYAEAKQPGIHTVLTSYDILGGPHTFTLVWSTNKFREANPKTFGAFLEAMREAQDRIAKDKPGVAKMYLEMTRSKESEADILAILNDPQVEFTMTPRATMKFADFMQQVGTLKTKPASWKELFSQEVHDLPGS